jgi:hypothetical protein
MKRLKILVWHVHGAYLNALLHVEQDWYLPVKPDRSHGYVGKGWTFDVPPYVREAPAEEVRDLPLDLVIYQSTQNYCQDAAEILSDAQRRLPAIYIEHNAPRPHPTDSLHPVDNPDVLLVHVTKYNELMWDNQRTPTTVIEHSVAIDPALEYRGDVARGVTVVNELQRRGRIAGADLFHQAREQLPLDLIGMQSEALGGFGDIPYRELHQRVARYRFMFSPMRYTSLPLAVIEAMTIGVPVVALATTAVPGAIVDGETGYISCDIAVLIERMRRLLADQAEARRLGANARAVARERFGLDRFVRDWDAAIWRAVGEAPTANRSGAAVGVGRPGREGP